MPDPISYCPIVPYSMPEDPEPNANATTTSARITGSGGSEGRANSELEGRGGSGPLESKPSTSSCVAPAFMAVATCGAVVSTQGIAMLVSGASCIGSLVALDECLARQRASAK